MAVIAGSTNANVTTAKGAYNIVDLNTNTTGQITTVVATDSEIEARGGGSHTAVTDAYLFKGRFAGNGNNFDNVYGLHLPDIARGSVSNYSIYAGTGDVRLGDLATAGTIAGTDNVIVADTDGVLKAVPQSSIASAGEWEDDGAGGIRATQANAAGNSVTVTDAGQVVGKHYNSSRW